MDQATPNNSSATNEAASVPDEVSKYKILSATEFAKRDEFRVSEEMLFLTQRLQKKLDRLELHQNSFEIRVSNTFLPKTVELFTQVLLANKWKAECISGENGVLWKIQC